MEGHYFDIYDNTQKLRQWLHQQHRLENVQVGSLELQLSFAQSLLFVVPARAVAFIEDPRWRYLTQLVQGVYCDPTCREFLQEEV